MRLPTTTHRSGAALIEGAFVLPVLLLLLLALIIGGMGVFHFQQVACLAHEAARYASVRGGGYDRDTEQASPTAAQIREAAVLPRAVALSPEQITVTVQWVDQGTGTAHDWDNADKDVKSITPQREYVTNTVRVTVTYVYSPGVLTGPLTLTSVCELPMAN